MCRCYKIKMCWTEHSIARSCLGTRSYSGIGVRTSDVTCWTLLPWYTCYGIAILPGQYTGQERILNFGTGLRNIRTIWPPIWGYVIIHLQSKLSSIWFLGGGLMDAGDELTVSTRYASVCCWSVSGSPINIALVRSALTHLLLLHLRGILQEIVELKVGLWFIQKSIIIKWENGNTKE